MSILSPAPMGLLSGNQQLPMMLPAHFWNYFFNNAPQTNRGTIDPLTGSGNDWLSTLDLLKSNLARERRMLNAGRFDEQIASGAGQSNALPNTEFSNMDILNQWLARQSSTPRGPY